MFLLYPKGYLIKDASINTFLFYTFSIFLFFINVNSINDIFIFYITSMIINFCIKIKFSLNPFNINSLGSSTVEFKTENLTVKVQFLS